MKIEILVKLHALANATKSPNWWKGLVQSTYTLQHPHSRVTGEEKVNTWTQRGHKQFYNKLRKPGLEHETLGSDTMSNFMH
jgi:hypothetical protein